MKKYSLYIALFLTALLAVGFVTFAKILSDKKLVEGKSNSEKKLFLSQKSPIVVALKSAEIGTVVTADMVESKIVPTSQIPGGAIWTTNLAVGLKVKRPFRKGTILTTGFFGLDESDPDFAAGIGTPFKRMNQEMINLQVNRQRRK